MTKRLISILLFIALLFLGFRLASQKPLWNDEIYSQLSSVENISVGQIISGRIGEGNTCPLFYLTQKFVNGLAQYHSPTPWQQGTIAWDFDRPEDRIILRVAPVVFTALAITIIFYFFVTFYSWGLAGFSVFLSLSSPMLWQYWAEARPYSLWLLLTTLQILLFLCLLRRPEPRAKMLSWLGVVHILLALTVILSLPQIFLVTGLLWAYRIRHYWLYWGLLIISIIIGSYYYATCPKYSFGLIFSFEQYLRAHVSRDRFYLAIIFVFVSALSFLPQRFKMHHWFKDRTLESWPVVFLAIGMGLCACGLLLVFQGQSSSNIQFPVTEKYFIFLTPVGIVTTTIVGYALVRSFKTRWVQVLMWVVIAGLTIPRFVKVIKDLIQQYPNILS